jgi:hypothetical protein
MYGEAVEEVTALQDVPGGAVMRYPWIAAAQKSAVHAVN